MHQHLVVNADARRIPLADASVHCVVTSPPYWGLRDYGTAGQLGLEPTPQEYVEDLVTVFREVRRVLRDDGVAWLNLGDTYVSKPGGRPRSSGLADSNLVGIPWRVALALQADGWILRAECIWHKRSPMPESVKNRPTRAHEHVFLLTKTTRYYYDWHAVLEKGTAERHGNVNGFARPERLSYGGRGQRDTTGCDQRNLRTVWTLSNEPYPGAHFAVFPRKLIEPLIKAGSSDRGVCPVCGAPWVRQVERDRIPTRPGTGSKVHRAQSAKRQIVGNRDPERHVTHYRSTGWQSSCRCGPADPVPAVVLDPFGGSGTVPLVAESLGRVGIGLDLSAEYCTMAMERIRRPHKPSRSRPVKPAAPLALKGLS